MRFKSRERARGSFSQRAPREKRFDQKEKMTPINVFFRAPQANQHLMVVHVFYLSIYSLT